MSLQVDGKDYRVGLDNAVSLSIPLAFDGSSPLAHPIEPARARVERCGSFVGDVREGGSCNWVTLTFNPHSHGTHTECLGHITKDRFTIGDCLADTLVTCTLVSVAPEENEGDWLIPPIPLKQGSAFTTALILRTLPNKNDKRQRNWTQENPPYLRLETMQGLVEAGVQHLLIDLPSVDRADDGGKLLNHCCFWNVDPSSRTPKSTTRTHCSITEMIFVPDTLYDGEYLLNLQVPDLETDAAPSRPILYPITHLSEEVHGSIS